LDQSFDGFTEAALTFEKNGLGIEINASADTFYAENILSFVANKKNLLACHNFYPQRYTGLDYDFFIACSQRYNKLGLRQAAFVSSLSAHHGPHQHSDGLCTVELHRSLPMIVQAKHLISIGLIDDIIIANAFASDDELKSLAKLPQEQLILDVEVSKQSSELERTIMFEMQHFNRGDINSYSHRSTMSRVIYKDKDFSKHDAAAMLNVGDVTIGNNNFSQYKGELGLVKRGMPNDGEYKNVVAKVIKDELFLLNYINPWTKFKFRETTR
jgi:hypothetical protein